LLMWSIVSAESMGFTPQELTHSLT
jgi:hypothetical protein